MSEQNVVTATLERFQLRTASGQLVNTEDNQALLVARNLLEPLPGIVNPTELPTGSSWPVQFVSTEHGFRPAFIQPGFSIEPSLGGEE